MYITLYFIVTRLPDSLRAVRDHFLALDPTDLTVDLLEKHLLATETSIVAVGAARGTPRTPFFEGCSPSPLAPSYDSAAAVDVLGTEDVGAASALSGKRRSGKGKSGKSGGGGSGGGGGGGGGVGGGGGGSGGGSGGFSGGGGGSGGNGGGNGGGSGSGGGGSGGDRGGVVQRGSSGGGQRSGVDIFALDYDAILAAMYALSFSAEGDCYLCVPHDPGIEAAALGASECALPGTALAEALHTFTLDSGASRYFFHDSTILTPLLAPVPVRLADPSGGPVLARSYTVLPCLAVPSGSLSSLHLPLSGSSPLLVSPPVAADSPLAPPHWSPLPATPSWHALPPPCFWSSQVSASPPALTFPALLPFVEGRRRAAPHSFLFPLLTAPKQTLHMDVWGPAHVSGQDRECYFLLVVDDYTRYTMVFPLHSKGEVLGVLIPWIRAVSLQLRERFREDLPVQRLHSDKGGEFSSDLLQDFCRGEGILESFTLSASLQQNGVVERHIDLVMEVARTSMIHAAAPHFLWPFAVRYAAHQLNLWPCVSLSESSPTLHWTGKVGDASMFRVWGSRAFVCDTSVDKLSSRAIPRVFLGFPNDAPGWQIYHPTSRRVLSSQDVTFDEVKRPPSSLPVFKARFVARGFSQQQGVHFFLTFSLTPKMTTLRVLLHVAAQRDYKLHSLDFGTAFLQGSLQEEIWLRRPPGFTGSFSVGTLWSLRRPVYGIRHASREWHDTLRTMLAALGFAPSSADPTLFLCIDTSLPPFYVLVYVNDLVFATVDTEAQALVKSELQKRHTCTDLGELRSYLGLQITRDRARRTITLTQSHMVHQVIQRFGFRYSSPLSTPLPTGNLLSVPPSDESEEPSGPYQELVGCLMYLMTCTRHDLAYPLSILARYVAPGRHQPEHWEAAKRVLRCLCSTSSMGLVLEGRGLVVLIGHADASWVDDLATHQSSQGYTFSLGSGSVSWRSTRSSSELRWLTYLLTDLGERPRSSPVLFIDNKAMIALCQEHRLEHRTKIIALRYFLARELQQRGQLRLAYVATRANTADIFTKAFQPGDHQRFCTVLGLVPTFPHLLTA
ncbi:unnamed protein product [Closterium sp. NIES-53]